MRLPSILFVAMATLLFTSCAKEKKGTCESSYINYQGYRLYSCKENVEAYLCENNSASFEDAFYTDKPTCESLGYGYQDSDGEWQYSSGENGIPGANGKWGNGVSGGGGGGSCSSGYTHIDDAQLDSYCGYAYAKRCLEGKALSSPEVQAVCTYYDDIATSSAPVCKFCH